jgi:hypothetical protein
MNWSQDRAPSTMRGFLVVGVNYLDRRQLSWPVAAW